MDDSGQPRLVSLYTSYEMQKADLANRIDRVKGDTAVDFQPILETSG